MVPMAKHLHRKRPRRGERRGRQTSWGGFSLELGWGFQGAKNDLDLLAPISSGG
jgi:hypothetical protein